MSQLTIDTVQDDTSLRAWTEVVDAVDVWGVTSFEDARYLREAQAGRVDYVLRLEGVPVGAAFVRPPGGGSETPCAVAGGYRPLPGAIVFRGPLVGPTEPTR